MGASSGAGESVMGADEAEELPERWEARPKTSAGIAALPGARRSPLAQVIGGVMPYQEPDGETGVRAGTRKN